MTKENKEFLTGIEFCFDPIFNQVIAKVMKKNHKIDLKTYIFCNIIAKESFRPSIHFLHIFKKIWILRCLWVVRFYNIIFQIYYNLVDLFNIKFNVRSSFFLQSTSYYTFYFIHALRWRTKEVLWNVKYLKKEFSKEYFYFFIFYPSMESKINLLCIINSNILINKFWKNSIWDKNDLKFLIGKRLKSLPFTISSRSSFLRSADAEWNWYNRKINEIFKNIWK